MSRHRIELAVLAFGVVFATALAFSLRSGLRPSRALPHEKAPRLPAASDSGQPTTVLSGFDYTETVRGKPSFRIRSERTVGFGPAAGLVPERYALEKVSLTLYPDQGAPVEVQAEKADYDARTKAAVLNGNVRWSDEKGAMGETETVAFRPERRVLEATKTVHFTHGTFDVTARAGSYDMTLRETHLAGPVRGAGTGQDAGGLSSLAADDAVYRRDEQLIELTGNVSAAGREGDRFACDRLLLKTGPDGKHFEWARASGNVRGRVARAAAAATAVTPRPPEPERDYAGDSGVLFFGPDGQAKSLALAGKPASVTQDDRTVSAATIDMDLAGGRLTAARAQGAVALAAPPNQAEADRASVAYGPAGEISLLELSGNVRMRGDGRAGTAEQAVQVPSRGIWLLTGDAAASAVVESGGSKVSAPKIVIGEKRRDVIAEGGARAVFAPEKGRPAAASLLGDPKRPTYGKAARIVLDDASRIATLSGAASLWQDASSVFADDITINDAERSLVAVGNVRAVLPPPPPAGSKLTPAPRAGGQDGAEAATVVTARRLHYREASNEADFSGGVVATRGAWRASADTGSAFLDGERKVQRVELSGNVSLSDAAAGRSGQADHAVDFPQQGRTILEGKPAVVTDTSGDRVSGATLTITERGRRVEVTASEGGKTVTVHRTRRD